MLFNSLDFTVFFPIVFLLYWFVFNKNTSRQNQFLLASSYFFYAWWDWRFLSLLIISSTSDFLIAQQLEKTKKQGARKQLVVLSLLINLGLLGYFKYSNFFIENFNKAFSLFGSDFNITSLKLILPIGISFYTFQTIGYVIDVYRKEWKAEKNLVDFFVFVSFFPQLVAGPIERARRFLPQLKKERVFDLTLAKDGMRQILWGLVLKCFVADVAALFVQTIVLGYDRFPGGTLLLGTIYFAIQIYADFAGYSAIAIGSSKLLGFDLKNNFSFPFTAQSSGELWRRWHISLMNWFRDYVYRSLGGRKKGFGRGLLNILIIFTLSGLWHGANWTFILWGTLTGLTVVHESIRHEYNIPKLFTFSFIPHKMTRSILVAAVISLIGMLNAGLFVMPDLHIAYLYYSKIFSLDVIHFTKRHSIYFIVVVILILYQHWMRHRKSLHGMDISDLPLLVRYPIYLTALFLFFYSFNIGQQFIYFQF